MFDKKAYMKKYNARPEVKDRYVKWIKDNDYHKQYYKNNRDKIIEEKTKWRANNPDKLKVIRKKNRSKSIRFLDKRPTLDHNPRTGICKQCGKKGLTHIHHRKYHKEDPLRDTIELCVGCHRRNHRRIPK